MKWKLGFGLMIVAASAIVTGGCEQKSNEGPGERAGKAIDDAINKADEKLKDAAKDAKEAVKDAAEDVKKKVEN